jgi:hypothetical protein
MDALLFTNWKNKQLKQKQPSEVIEVLDSHAEMAATMFAVFTTFHLHVDHV